MTAIDRLRSAGELQARLCRENGSPTYAAIIDALDDRLEDRSLPAAVELLLADGREPVSTALHLRLLGAVHRLALTDEACPMRAHLPSTGGTVAPAAAVAAFFETVASCPDVVGSEMAHGVQTNEIGRTAALGAGLHVVAERFGLPLDLLEVGASAGLNLWPDRVRVEAGATAWGPVDSAVRLVDHFVAGTPTPAGFSIVGRRGCDRDPVDVTLQRGRDLLRSFVWPEHLDRMASLDAAITLALAADEPVVVDRSDATTWIRDALVRTRPGATTVVFHSIVMPYLSDDERAAFASVVRTAGGHARADQPLAWLAIEPTPRYEGVRLTLETWPGGERSVLATCTPHGREIRWGSDDEGVDRGSPN